MENRFICCKNKRETGALADATQGQGAKAHLRPAASTDQAGPPVTGGNPQAGKRLERNTGKDRIPKVGPGTTPKSTSTLPRKRRNPNEDDEEEHPGSQAD